MSAIVQLDMTLEEARETDRLIKRHINTTRYLLLDMRDRKGWKALGYESFVEYGKQSLGYEKRYIYELADAGEISIQLGYTQECAIAHSPPPESQLRPLKSVPESDRKAIWDEATRKVEEENAKLTAKRVEEAVAEWKQRNEEWKSQWKNERDKAGRLQAELDIAKTTSTVPSDYESTKTKAAQLQAELETLKKEQAKLINSQVKAKLHEYQSEVDDMERKKDSLQEQVDRMKDYLASLDKESRRLETHGKLIEETRLTLMGLAVFLCDEEPIEDAETRKLWLSLAEMLGDAMKAVRQFVGHDHFTNALA